MSSHPRIDRHHVPPSLDEAFSAVEILSKTIHENESLRRRLSDLEAENNELKKRLREGRQALRQLASHILGDQHGFGEDENVVTSGSHSDGANETPTLDGKCSLASISDEISILEALDNDEQKDTDCPNFLSLSTSSVDTVRVLSSSIPTTTGNHDPHSQTSSEEARTVKKPFVVSLRASGSLTNESERSRPLDKYELTEAAHSTPHLPTSPTKKKELKNTSKGSQATTLQHRRYDEQITWQTAEDSLWKDSIREEPIKVKPPASLCRNTHGCPEIHCIYLKGLPRKLDLETLCKSLSGGRIHRIFLYNTGPYKTSEALVAFVKPSAAYNLYRSIRVGGLQIAGYDVKASDVLSEPRSGYSVSPGIQADIMENGWTRCLILSNLPKTLTLDVVRSHIAEKLLWIPGKKQTPLIESIKLDESEKTIRLNMAGIYLAQSVRSNLKKRAEYTHVKFIYARDPCDTGEKQLVECLNKPPALDTTYSKETPLGNLPTGTASWPRLTNPSAKVSPFMIYRNALLSTTNPNPRCRKVVFAQLPRATTLSSFAQNIRGGVVEGIYLYNDKLAAPPEATVIFKDPKAAWYCYTYFKTINPTFSGGTATLVPFDEIRPDPRAKSNVFSEPIPVTARRSVRLYGLPRFATQEHLEDDIEAAIDVMQRHNSIGRSSELLESLTLDQYRRGAEVVFSQIKVARGVIKRLRSNKNYSRCTFSYSKDPCEGRIEGLFPQDKHAHDFNDRQPGLHTSEMVPDSGVQGRGGSRKEGPQAVRTADSADSIKDSLPLPLYREKPRKTVRFALDFGNI